jgi:uncharacterized protein (DUF927 family)
MNLEVPLIPFTSNHYRYAGRIVLLKDWVVYVEDDGIEVLFETLAKKYQLPKQKINNFKRKEEE